MKIWALLRTHQKIVQDVVLEFPGERPTEEEAWQNIIDELCHALHQSRPVILNKHFQQLASFARTTFLPADFMEPVAFDKLELEIFPEKTKQAQQH